MQPWLHHRVSEVWSPQSPRSPQPGPGQWVLLSYRLPREPSGPRTTLWRRLKRLGVAQLSDGLVALPADARTRESLEWLADDVLAADGTAGLWVVRPATLAQERELAAAMAAARAEEYSVLAAQCRGAVGAQPAERRRALRRQRGNGGPSTGVTSSHPLSGRRLPRPCGTWPPLSTGTSRGSGREMGDEGR